MGQVGRRRISVPGELPTRDALFPDVYDVDQYLADAGASQEPGRPGQKTILHR